MIKIHQKQPIQAEQFDGKQKYMFGHKVISDNSLVDALTHDPVYYSILINEDDSDDPKEDPNEVVFEIGDWIIKYGEDIHAIVNDIFKKTYAELPVIPKAVADWINECISIGWTRNFLDVCYRAPDPVDKWIDNNSNMFARAWLDGYQLEES